MFVQTNSDTFLENSAFLRQQQQQLLLASTHASCADVYCQNIEWQRKASIRSGPSRTFQKAAKPLTQSRTTLLLLST